MKIQRKTLKDAIYFEDVGLHSGAKVKLSLIPAKNKNIEIIRTDLNRSFTLANKKIYKVKLNTEIGKWRCSVKTVEHLFAALHVFGITDLKIEINAPETPIMDGSALLFANKIKEVGVETLSDFVEPIFLNHEIEVTDKHKKVNYKPYESLKLKYFIDFPHPAIKQEEAEFDITEETFIKEIAPARTFGFLKDLEQLKKHGLVRGARIDNVIALDDEKVLNPEGLRFKDEFVRHKILDLLGDLYLMGRPVHGFISASCAGHSLHQKLVGKLVSS